MDYAKRMQRKYLPTNEIRKRGFIREFKSLLLKEHEVKQGSPQYGKVEEALRKILCEKNEYPKDGIFSEGTYNKWWNCKGYPGKKNQEMIDTAFPGLIDKWFNRERFVNRFQRYLGCLDLPYIYSLGGSDSSDSSDSSEPAVEQAETVLGEIHDDWKPVSAVYDRKIDIYLRGPNKRGGLNVSENSPYSEQVEPVPDERESIDYDLTIGEESFIGLCIPDYLLDIYEENNEFSVMPFLYVLLCLNLKSRSKYRLDLIFDFLTAISCAFVLQQDKYQIFLHSHIVDRGDRAIFNLLDESYKYFYEVQYYSIEQKLKEFDELEKQESLKIPRTSDFGHFLLNPTLNYLSTYGVGPFVDIFFHAMRDLTDEDELEKFIIERPHNVTETYPYTAKYASDIYVGLLDSLTSARSEFISQIDVLGMSEKQLLSTLMSACLHSRTILLPRRKNESQVQDRYST